MEFVLKMLRACTERHFEAVLKVLLVDVVLKMAFVPEGSLGNSVAAPVRYRARLLAPCAIGPETPIQRPTNDSATKSHRARPTFYEKQANISLLVSTTVAARPLLVITPVAPLSVDNDAILANTIPPAATAAAATAAISHPKPPGCSLLTRRQKVHPRSRPTARSGTHVRLWRQGQTSYNSAPVC